jgi:hypothetical protein
LGAWTLIATLMTTSCGGGGTDEIPGLLTLSGVVRDYFTDGPVASAVLTIEQLSSATTSSADGAYGFSNIPSNSLLTVIAARTNYRPTRNAPIQSAASSLVHPVSIVSIADVARQYTASNLLAVAGTAVVIANLTDGGLPLEGVPLANITLVDAALSPVGNGPYIFGASGDVNPALTVTAAFAGRSRVAFLNVPPGIQTLTVALPGTPPRTLTATIVSSGGGVTFITL